VRADVIRKVPFGARPRDVRQAAFLLVRPPANRERESRGVLRRWEFLPTPTMAAPRVLDAVRHGATRWSPGCRSIACRGAYRSVSLSPSAHQAANQPDNPGSDGGNRSSGERRHTSDYIDRLAVTSKRCIVIVGATVTRHSRIVRARDF
jgi:hypothetical protein